VCKSQVSAVEIRSRGTMKYWLKKIQYSDYRTFRKLALAVKDDIQRVLGLGWSVKMKRIRRSHSLFSPFAVKYVTQEREAMYPGWADVDLNCHGLFREPGPMGMFSPYVARNLHFLKTVKFWG